MFDNVLVGVDGGPGGPDAIVLAAKLAAPGGAVTLARVVGGAHMPSHMITPGIVEDERRAAREDLEKERERADINATVMLIEAVMPARGLHDQAEEQHADLLVLGSSHRGPWGRALLGDDTRDALAGAPCAIAVAPKGYADQVTPLAAIGVGYDGSPESEAALDVAQGLAERTHARVRAFQVITIPTYSLTGVIGPVLAGVDAMVNDAAARAGRRPGVEGSAQYGLTGEELAAFSAKVDLLVIGSRGYGPLHRVISGSTARYLQRHARGPLLILPRGTKYAETAAGKRRDRADDVASAR